MDRKRFLWFAATGAAALYFPFSGCAGHKASKALYQPQVLSHFCDAKALKEIGESYRKLAPAEDREDQLQQLLLTNAQGKPLPAGNDDNIRKALDERVTADFKSGNTLVIKGWVLSQTEARQCALFSLQS